MRAVVLRGGRLEVRETDDPVPGPGELLLRTLSTAICASDVHFMDHHELVTDDGTGRFVYDEDRDMVLGHEFVGELVERGPDCSGEIPLGARVTAMPIRLTGSGFEGTRVIGQHPEAQGSFGELLVVSELMAREVPEGVSADAVAVVDAFAVGEFYVRSSAIAPGEIPIVIGAGAIGLSAIAALVSRGIEPIIVSDRKPDRRAMAERFGAHTTVDPDVTSPFDVWRLTAMERGIMKPVVVFECVGAPGLIQHLVDSCDMGTRIYAAGGWYTGDTLDCTRATHAGVTIQFGGGPMPEDWYGTFDAVCEGRLDPTPSEVIGLDGVPDAMRTAPVGPTAHLASSCTRMADQELTPMTDDFATRYGPWALIAGASDGVGAAYARAMAAQGVNVLLLARRLGLLDEVAEAIREETGVDTRAVAVDLAEPEAMDRIVELTDGLEVGMVMYNAGGDPNYQPFLANSIETALGMLHRNASVPLQVCHHFGGAMVARGRGGIVLVSSGAGLVGAPNMVAYASTKAFDTVLAESLWAEWHDLGVDVLGLVLGMTDTPALRTLLADRGVPVPDDQPIEGASTADEVVDDALANLANGPTWFVGEQLRSSAPLLGGMDRSDAVRVMIEHGGLPGEDR